MRICNPYLLRYSRLEDQITILNLVYPGHTLVVGKKWFQKVVEHGLLDDCCFNMSVVNCMFNPPFPELL